jgi:hypothetical protein
MLRKKTKLSSGRISQTPNGIYWRKRRKTGVTEFFSA